MPGGTYPAPASRGGSGAVVPPGDTAVGSHLDSVPDGGAFDGPLGVVSAFAAIDQLRAEGFEPARPIAVAAFAEEEGGRFGVACLGSRLLTGAIDPATARGLRDADGVTLGQAMHAAGHDPAGLGPDEELLARLGCYVELHIEQGRKLDGLGAAIGLAESIWPHGRWRLDFTGRADHAGTAALADRADPMLPYAHTVLAARNAAAEHGALATIGKVTAQPGAANAVSSAVHAWLDVRAPGTSSLDGTLDQVLTAAAAAAQAHRVDVRLAPGVIHPGGRVRHRAAGPAGGRAGRARHHRPGAAHRGGPRRRDPGRPAAHRHAVRAQPDRGIPLPGRARRPRGLRRRGDRAGRRAPRPGRPVTTPEPPSPGTRPPGPGAGRPGVRRWHAELAWPGSGEVQADVLIEAV